MVLFYLIMSEKMLKRINKRSDDLRMHGSILTECGTKFLLKHGRRNLNFTATLCINLEHNIRYIKRTGYNMNVMRQTAS